MILSQTQIRANPRNRKAFFWCGVSTEEISTCNLAFHTLKRLWIYWARSSLYLLSRNRLWPSNNQATRSNLKQRVLLGPSRNTAMQGTKHKIEPIWLWKYLLSSHNMSYIISIDQRFARALDKQAALRLAQLGIKFTTFKYNLQGLQTKQDLRMFIIEHPFDWHTFDFFVGMFQPPGCLLDWAIDDYMQVRPPLLFF